MLVEHREIRERFNYNSVSQSLNTKKHLARDISLPNNERVSTSLLWHINHYIELEVSILAHADRRAIDVGDGRPVEGHGQSQDAVSGAFFNSDPNFRLLLM